MRSLLFFRLCVIIQKHYTPRQYQALFFNINAVINEEDDNEYYFKEAYTVFNEGLY